MENQISIINHALEEAFNFRLTNISKTSTEIKAWKWSKTKYLDGFGINWRL